MLVYQNYHRHSHYTNPRVPDSVATNEDYAKRAVELGQTILSSCEHGWQGYYAECYELAKTYGLKMLFSAEAYWVKDRLEKDKTNCHIFLAAKNERGRQALNDVLSEANISGFYGRPRLDLPLLLSLPPDDIWCTSACIAGWLYDDADELWKQLADHFGKNFYLEVQYHDCNFREDAPYASQAALNAHVVELSRRWGVPLIMGCDSHYILPEDKQRRLDYTTSKNVVYEDEAGMILDYPDGDTAYQRFAKQAVLTHDEIMEAITNTNVFLEVEEYDSPIFNTEIKMPSMYPDWTQEQKDAEYKRLVLSGWDAYKHEVPEDQWPHYEEEIAKEMQVVIDTKMADYFILNYHVIKRGKENGGWLTKTGRGCFTESAMVKTLTGLKSIKDVQVGDTVFDLEGRPRKVLNTTKYTINEPMVQIDNVYSYGKHHASVCTPDHKIYVLRDGAHQWVPAGALKETDYLVRPKLHLDENGPQIIDLANYIDSKDWYDDEYIYEYNQYRSSYPYCPKHVSSLIGCGKSVMEHTGNGKPPAFKGKHQWILDKFFEVTPFTSLEEYAAYVKDKRTTKISRYIQVDSTFCRFLGLMYGDGFSSDKVGGEIGLALNATNRKMRENRITFCEIAKRLGLQTSERKSTNRHLVQIYMYSRVFKNFLHSEVFVSKKGQDKLVNPQWILQPKENRRGLLNGLLLADGSSCEKGRVSFDNTSLSLINVVDILIGSLGNEPISISKRPAWIDSRGYHCRDSYKLRYYTESQTTAKYNERAIIHEEYTYYPVRSIIQLPARPVEVYDLEVEGSHSYILNGFVVHNSCVSFITNKLLGFTEVDRIAAPVHMYPERFMSTERILKAGTCPDIDFNVAEQEPFARAQQEVLGEDHAYPMLAYGTMLTSAAWKLYAKAQDIPFEVANAVSEQIKRYELAVKHADEDEKDDIDVYDYISPEFKDVFEGSKGYRGIVSSWSVAPCAYLLYGRNIRKEIGLVRIKDHLCCCMDGHWAERCHFLKNDLLIVSVWKLIYEIFHRLGMEPFNVNELLRMCEADSKPWGLYRRGATLCLNQVEKKGTSARVAQYHPTNISELSAFIAAIRPGFASMFSTFASRVPFSYGVKAFDNLIQTKEMPNSYVLYQEQEMQALHYAGIPMADCYTAIKDIAKKRREKVLAYKDVFKKGFSKAIVDDEAKTPEEADELTEKLWRIIEDSASYLFNSSHAYCVALDSLYEAWLKANHPLEFYEVALNLYEKKGDKDKVYALKEEAEKYFDILFPPMRYGQDNRQMRADPATNSIVNSLGSIKGMSKTMGAKLYECAQVDHKSFFDVLRWLDERSIKSAKVEPLIKIDYFNQFGNNVELLRLLQWWDFFKQGTAKTISKEKLTPEFEELLARHATDKSVKGEPLKSYKITDMDGLLKDIETHVFSQHLDELPYRVKAANQNDILGYVDMTTQKEEDRRKLYLLNVRPLIGKWNAGKPWKYVFHCKSVGSGKVSQLSVSPYLYNSAAAPAMKGDVILAKHVHKDEKGYWQLDSYEILPG